MSSKLFLDSSILVEWAKKSQTDLFDYLTQSNSFELCISQIVLSEFTFYWLAVGGSKAPLTLKRDGGIGSILLAYDPGPILTRLSWVDADHTIIPLYLRYMQQYNLLPNDALILATCKLKGIDQLASYDTDFAAACTGERIRLVQTVADLTI
ncbi:MAG TPA: type II toxin-antitoxin system VapC family toxin [Fibrella sp.]